jgi:hypothetical protein
MKIKFLPLCGLALCLALLASPVAQAFESATSATQTIDLNRKALVADGTPIVLKKGQTASCDKTDDNFMALLIANGSPYADNRVIFTVVAGGELEDYKIPAGFVRPTLKIENWGGNPLTVANISNAESATIMVALYSQFSEKAGTLLADGNKHPLTQCAAVRTKLEGMYYNLEIGAPLEESIFAIFLGDDHPIQYWVNSAPDSPNDNDTVKKCTGNRIHIRIKNKNRLFILNASPTHTSKGYVRLTRLD